MTLTRRSFALGGSMFLAASLCSGPNRALAASTRYDLTDPRDNLSAFIKVMGDLSGAPSWITAQGRIYALRPNEMPLPILAVEGLRYVRFEKLGDDAFNFHLRDWAFYKDIETGAVLDRFENPLTGARNETRHILTGFYSWSLGPNGQSIDGYEGDAWLIDRPFVLPWTVDGDQVSVPLELLVRYASGSAGGEWMNFISSLAALDDPEVNSAPAKLVWTGHSGWVRWMEMGDRPGRTLWQSSGQKHDSRDGLRAEFVRAANRYFPGSLDDPEGYEKTSYTVSPPEETEAE